MKKFIGCICVLALTVWANAQSTYIIRFKDKGTSPYAIASPGSYLTQRALDRRSRYAISIDSTDLPVTPRYVDSLRLAGTVTVLNVSRWLNAVSIQTTDAAALARINAFPFVHAVTSIAPRLSGRGSGIQSASEKADAAAPFGTFHTTADFYDYGLTYAQIHIHNGEFLHNIGLRGQSMVFGILDAGFQNYLSVKAFDSVRANGQILGVYDFVAKDSSVNEDNSHGMQCFSTIGGNIPGQFVGTAPKANFYLFRSENSASEYPIEEFNWVCAAERVDSLGADLISSSLGYNTYDPPFTHLDHTYAEFNGNTAMVTIGADLAARKGILVVNSAGNEGNKAWHYIVAPADGDSVMAVGAVAADSSVAAFSSFGPSSDGQIKPDVASVGEGTYVQYPGNFIATNNGTSFAAPNMAGLAGCLWQGFRELNNMWIIDALRRSGNKAGAPDARVGYGIPNVKKAVMILLQSLVVSNALVSNCKASLSWTSKDATGMKYEIERMLAGQNTYVKVGELPSGSGAFGPRSYQFEDVLTGVLAGTHSYRIRQVLDTEPSSFFADYLDTLSISLAANCTATGVNPVNPQNAQVTLLPNPAYGEVAIKIQSAEAMPQLLIRIFNSKGQEVASVRKSKGSGTALFTIGLAQLAAGKYYVSVYNDTHLLSTNELVKL